MDRMNIFLLVAFIVVFYLFFIRPQVKQRKQQEDFFQNLKPGSKVVTIGGLCGIIYKINNERVLINTYDNMKIEFLKNSISIEESMKASTTTDK